MSYVKIPFFKEQLFALSIAAFAHYYAKDKQNVREKNHMFCKALIGEDVSKNKEYNIDDEKMEEKQDKYNWNLEN